MPTNIEWTEETWNPIAGCSKVSPGCAHCYAEVMAKRLKAMGQRLYQDVLDDKGRWNGRLHLAHPARIEAPLHWKKPRRIFVNSMSDLFHHAVQRWWIDEIIAIIAATPRHTYQVLTKRPDRMLAYFSDPDLTHRIFQLVKRLRSNLPSLPSPEEERFPLPNLWLGVSVEDQKRADERIHLLQSTPSALRFLSCEPLLGTIDLSTFLSPPSLSEAAGKGAGGLGQINWIIAGGESGPHARPMHPDWARSLRNQCQLADIPFFFKSWGNWQPTNVENVLFSKPNRHDGHNYAKLTYPGFKEQWMANVGAKKAGRLLDGQEHNQYPTTPTQE